MALHGPDDATDPILASFTKIQIVLTFLVPAYSGCPGKETVKRASVLVVLST